MTRLEQILTKAIEQGIIEYNEAYALIAAIKTINERGYDEEKFGTQIRSTVKEFMEEI